MVRFTIPSIPVALLAMSIGAFGSDEAAHAQKLQRNGKGSEATNLPKYVKIGAESDDKPQLKLLELLKGSEAKQLRASTAIQQKSKKGKKKSSDIAGIGSDIEGAYAVVLSEGTFQGYANGVVVYDGAGSMSGTLNFNTPGAQESFTSAVSGTYDVENDINGVRNQEWTYETTPNGPLTLVSTLSLRSLQDGVATEVDGSLTTPSQFYEGRYVSFTLFRLPERTFSESDLLGVWNIRGFSSGQSRETGAIGRITVSEGGTFEGFIIVNDFGGVAGPNFDAPAGADGNTRTLFPSEVAGTHSINEDGTGEWELQNLTWIEAGIPIILQIHTTVTEVKNDEVVTIEAFADQGGPITGPDAPFAWTFTKLDL